MTTLPYLAALRKFQMSYQWDESKYQRDDAGRFTSKGGGGGAPSFRQTPLKEASPGPQRRSLTRGEGWQRLGNALPGIPISYTGSTEREKPIGSFTQREIVEQIPKAVSPEEHQALFRKLKMIVRMDRTAAIERAHKMWKAPPSEAQRRDKRLSQPKYRVRKKPNPDETPLVPEGVTRRTLQQAYNHAAVAALHDHGIVDASRFKMDDHLKAEMAPLRPFMRFIRRRLGEEFKRSAKGSWKPYRAEFGIPFDQKKYGRVTGSRLRTRPMQELVKTTPALTKSDDASFRRAKIRKVMSEFKAGTLRSGKKDGPVVTSRAQAIAIAMSEAGLGKSFGGPIDAEIRRASRLIRDCDARMRTDPVDIGSEQEDFEGLPPEAREIMPLAQSVLTTIGTGGTI